MLIVVIGIEEYDCYVLDFIEVMCWIKENLLVVKVLGGIFNVLFSFWGNNYVCEVMYVVFLYYVICVGLDMGIVNVGMLVVYEDIELELCEVVEDVILVCCLDVIECLLMLVDCYKDIKCESVV